MAKGTKITHGRSKFISNYGGVGSIIETIDCSILIETFDNWGYENSNLSKYIVIDDRLLSRLKSRFPKLRHLVKIPSENDNQNGVSPVANYFPKWFYCSKCHRLKHYADWRNCWKNSGKNIDYFSSPKCYFHDCKERELEQIRFIMTCTDGHVHDLPWKFWNQRPANSAENVNSFENEEDEDSNTTFELNLTNTCCNNQDLRYILSKENSSLSGIFIKCEFCKTKSSLKGIFGYQQKCEGSKLWLGLKDNKIIYENCDQKSQVKIKSSNSVYYANTLSSLWIPEKQIISLTPEIRKEIEEIVAAHDYERTDLTKFATRKTIPIDLIDTFLNDPDSNYVPENIFRQAEYDFFLNKEQPDSNDIKFNLVNCEDEVFGFERLVKIKKIKKVTVQTSFTRQETIDVDSILQEDGGYQYLVKRQSVSKDNFSTKLLPCVESYGEGILFILDKKKLNEWELGNEVIERVKLLVSHSSNSDWQSHKIEANKISPRKVLIHTLSHLIIRELEYVCGYPASSLNERLYVNDNMYGFLISAYDGIDGFLGGLSNLCNDVEKLQKIIKSAINRSVDCSLDPICFESDGQGIAKLNLAACHSCTLLPETTCELSNLFLDRQLIINSSFGYFSALIEN